MKQNRQKPKRMKVGPVKGRRGDPCTKASCDSIMILSYPYTAERWQWCPGCRQTIATNRSVT